MEDKIKHLLSKYQTAREWHLGQVSNPDSIDYTEGLSKGAVMALNMVIKDLENLGEVEV